MNRDFRFLSIVKLLVGVFFAGIGLFYILFPETIQFLSPSITRIIGVMFFARGVFRIYMSYKAGFNNEF